MTKADAVPGAKRALRAIALRVRAGLGPSERRAAARAVTQAGLSFLPDWQDAVVAGYAAIGDELDPAPLLERLAAEGRTLALPVMVSRQAPLAFRQWRPGAPVRTNSVGVPEPIEDAPPAIPAVVLVPLVAFDEAGYRLGMGAGYYDRTLRALRSARDIVAVGLAFDEQRVDAVPHEAFDERLDWVLTPSGAIRIGG